jgi:DNA-binding CsgD family transcriptional regulator/tetratricopeptide (TPR) repeat protein
LTLLERTSALELLHRLVGEAASCSGAVVTVTGEAGIGKTSVIRAFLAALPRGTEVLDGWCDDLLTARPLGPLRDIAGRIGGELESALLAGRTEDVFGAFVTEIQARRPTVLVIEDVHWADDATLDVLAYLVRRIGSLPTTLILSFRNDTAGRKHPLYGLLATGGDGRIHRLPLAPLSPEAVATLASGTGWDPRSLHELTGGNPFYVSEALATPGSPDVPDTVAEAVGARMRRLSPRCRGALEQLSVVPRLVEFAMADELFGDKLTALTEAEESGIVEVRPEGIAYRHELARRGVERGIPRLRRRVLHAAVVRALVARPQPDLARIVHHSLQSADEEAVCRYAPRAGRESAAAGSHRQALAHFEVALRFAGRLSIADRAQVLDGYAWELYNALRFEEAVRASEQAVSLWTEIGEPVPLGEALGGLSRHYMMLGCMDDALRVARQAIDVLTPTGSDTAIASAVTLHACLLSLSPESRAAAAQLERGARLAATSNRADLLCLNLNYQSIARADLSPAGRVDLVRQSLQMAIGLEHQEYIARGYTNLAELLYRYGRFAELRECLDGGLRYTADHGFRSHAYNLEVHRSLLSLRTGDLADGQIRLQALIDDHEEPGMLRAYGMPSLLRVQSRRTNRVPLDQLCQEWDSALEHSLLTGLAFAGTALAEWAFLNQRADIAERVLEWWLPHADRPGAEPITAELMRYCARAGARVTARADCPMPWSAGIDGDWRAAADAWAAVGDPYERALELSESGQVEPMIEALSILDHLGADAAAGLVRKKLKSCGLQVIPRGPMPTTRANPVGLTRRQVDVLTLLAGDLTNAQIAAELVLSVRTVDHHMSSILAKMGVESRGAAKKNAISLGLVACL